MNKEEVKHIVLSTMEEIVLDPVERGKIAKSLDTVRYELSSQRECRREALLSLIFCFTAGILISVLCLGAQMSPAQTRHPAETPSATVKPWWEFPFTTPVERHSR